MSADASPSKATKWHKHIAPSQNNNRAVFMFYSKSADKLPGRGVGESLNEESPILYEDLQNMTDWRRVLSNFWVEPFLYNGKQYSSAEHAFHAEKFYMVASLRRGEQQKAAKAYADQFSTEFSQLSDADIKKRGGKSGFAMTTQEVNRWAEISEERMTSVLEHKFTQCHIAKRVLLATGNSTLVHHMGRSGVRQWWHFLEVIRENLRLQEWAHIELDT
eukprot:gene20420-24458_t